MFIWWTWNSLKWHQKSVVLINVAFHHEAPNSLGKLYINLLDLKWDGTWAWTGENSYFSGVPGVHLLLSKHSKCHKWNKQRNTTKVKHNKTSQNSITSQLMFSPCSAYHQRCCTHWCSIHWQGGLLPFNAGKLWRSNYTLFFKKKTKPKINIGSGAKVQNLRGHPQASLTPSAAGSFPSWKGFHQNPSYR